MTHLQPRLAFFAVGLCAAFILAPASARATDPVKDLENALRIDPQQLIEPAEQRKLVDKILPKLKTLPELRGAYFLKEWLPYVKFDKDTKKHLDDEMYKRRKGIGDALEKAVREAAKDDSVDKKIAVAVMIAEMADRDQPEERSKNGKYASVFVDLLIGGKNSLIESTDTRVKQAAWHALGKVTPRPVVAIRRPRSFQKLMSPTADFNPTGSPVASAILSAKSSKPSTSVNSVWAAGLMQSFPIGTPSISAISLVTLTAGRTPPRPGLAP